MQLGGLPLQVSGPRPSQGGHNRDLTRAGEVNPILCDTTHQHADLCTNTSSGTSVRREIIVWELSSSRYLQKQGGY